MAYEYAPALIHAGKKNRDMKDVYKINIIGDYYLLAQITPATTFLIKE